jgi:hypothetical protein
MKAYFVLLIMLLLPSQITRVMKGLSAMNSLIKKFVLIPKKVKDIYLMHSLSLISLKILKYYCLYIKTFIFLKKNYYNYYDSVCTFF